MKTTIFMAVFGATVLVSKQTITAKIFKKSLEKITYYNAVNNSAELFTQQ